jgi:predicted phage terminase large subunit-like protein
MGSLEFSAQYQQRPIPLGGNLVKWVWFRTHENTPVLVPSDRIIVSWDTAMTARELSDYSACVVLLVRNGTAFVLDVMRERLEYPALRRKVVEVHRRWHGVVSSYTLLVENKGSGMSLVQDLRNDGIHAVAVDPEGDKVMRMNAETARIEAGAVSLPRRAPWLEEFKRELMAFPNGRYDDQLDALSQALKRAFERRGAVSVGFVTGLY